MSEKFVKQQFSLRVIVFSLFGLGLIVSGCEVSNTAATTPAPGGGGSGGGDGAGDALVFQVTATAKDANYSILVSKDGDGTTPCVPDADEKEITCIVDLEELDLFFHGLTITATAPYASCKYVGSRPQFYSVAPVGHQPTDVFYEIDANGALEDPTGNVANVNVGDTDPDIYYRINGTWVKHEDLYGVAAVAAEDLRCPYDYSKVSTFSSGKNCCYIEYNKITDNDGDPETSREDWGGKLSDCYRGAGIQDWQKTNANGFPVELIEAVDDAAGLNSTFTITAPIADDELEEQVSVANYFTGGTPPRALSDGNPYYWYKCYDANREVQYQVNVLVREWNTAGERPEGDDDVGGAEGAPFTDEGNNDFTDWDDITISLSGFQLSQFGFSLDANNTTPDVDNYLFNITAGATVNERWLGFAP